MRRALPGQLGRQPVARQIPATSGSRTAASLLDWAYARAAVVYMTVRNSTRVCARPDRPSRPARVASNICAAAPTLRRVRMATGWSTTSVARLPAPATVPACPDAILAGTVAHAWFTAFWEEKFSPANAEQGSVVTTAAFPSLPMPVICDRVRTGVRARQCSADGSANALRALAARTAR